MLLSVARHLSVGPVLLFVGTAHPKIILNLLPKFHVAFFISRVATVARNRHRHRHRHIHRHINTKTVHFMVLKAVHMSQMYTPNIEMYRIMLRCEAILFSKTIHTVEFTVNFYKILIYVAYDFNLNYVIGDK